MVTCNICGENKSLDKIQAPFRYVCKECWNRMSIWIKNKSEIKTTPVKKDLIY
jgi:uncharacterized protein YlaI